MVAYNLSHLTQPDNQEVVGPIQDDEALFLFALIRVTRLRRVLEIGGLNGYSAANFLAAVGAEGVVYTVDINPVPSQAPTHFPVQTAAASISGGDVGNAPLDLIFFDCHDYEGQMALLDRLESEGIVTARTMLALHDTNLHPRHTTPVARPVGDGWAHQPVERMMVNALVERGFHALVLGTRMDTHSPALPYRHGLTVMQRFIPLET